MLTSFALFASHLGSIKIELSDIKKISTQRNETTVTENSQSGDTEALTAIVFSTVQATTTSTVDCNVLMGHQKIEKKSTTFLIILVFELFDC